MTARGPEGLELSGLDPVLHGAHRHLTPARDFTCRQITHRNLKTSSIPSKWGNSSCSRAAILAKLIFLADCWIRRGESPECRKPRGGSPGISRGCRALDRLAGEALTLVRAPVDQGCRSPEGVAALLLELE